MVLVPSEDERVALPNRALEKLTAFTEVLEAAKKLVSAKLRYKSPPGTGPSYRPNGRWTKEELALHDAVKKLEELQK